MRNAILLFCGLVLAGCASQPPPQPSRPLTRKEVCQRKIAAIISDPNQDPSIRVEFMRELSEPAFNAAWWHGCLGDPAE